MTRPKLTSEQKALRERVEAAYHKQLGFRYHHFVWNKNLWKKVHAEIIEFLEDRFRNTVDAVEYYACMVYLFHEIPDHELFVEFGDAPQVVVARKTYSGMGQKTSSERSVFSRKNKRVFDTLTPQTPPCVGGLPCL